MGAHFISPGKLKGSAGSAVQIVRAATLPALRTAKQVRRAREIGWPRGNPW
jgi:hypothetical protein